MKIIGSILIIFTCTALGFWNAENYHQKFIVYSDFRKFHRSYLHALKTTRKTIPKLLKEGEYSKNFLLKFEQYQSGTKKDDALWSDYCGILGCSDAFTQLSSISAFTEEIERRFSNEKEKADKYISLNQKLGFLIGVFFVILLI